MTRIIIQGDNVWTKKKTASAVSGEIQLLKKAIERTKTQIQTFEKNTVRLIAKRCMEKSMTWNSWNGKESWKPWRGCRKS
ncbi:MAG: hypothetical protein Q9P90_06415 [candidate division KSB1 bacterium]|nr:hypothetical protein [candidate division KSB1 bacterium]